MHECTAGGAASENFEVPPLSTSMPVLIWPPEMLTICPAPMPRGLLKMMSVPVPPSGVKRKLSAEISEPKLMK